MHRFIAGLVLITMSTPASGATVDIAAPLRTVAQQQRATARFDRVIKVVTSSATCGRFGVVVDDEGVQELARRTVAEAIMDGMTPDVATILFIEQMKDEGGRLQAITDEATQEDTMEAAERLIDFWGERCRDLMTDSVTSRYFHVGVNK